IQKEILIKYSLEKEKYFFYPAQFWTHKNHYNLIISFIEFLKIHPNYKLVFTGSDKGNLNYLKNIINENDMENKVLILGFVEKDALYSLYKNASALIMPTFLGPTNMPLIEALELECPVLCSDFEGHREILENCALYFNPANTDEIYEKMIDIINPDFRQKMKILLEKRIENNLFTIDNAIKAIENNLLEIISIRNCWE
ncbi:MAG: glycosyltransferase, partial [Spirochaetes bacterium]|nr:glycosyltransferase [Spirochaetota bacterium]